MPVDNTEFLAFLYRETGAENPNQLAHKIKVSSGKLADWKAGRYAPTLRILKRIHEEVPTMDRDRLFQAAGIGQRRTPAVSSGTERAPIANLPADLDPNTRGGIEAHLINQVALFERMTREITAMRKELMELRALAVTEERTQRELRALRATGRERPVDERGEEPPPPIPFRRPVKPAKPPPPARRAR